MGKTVNKKISTVAGVFSFALSSMEGLIIRPQLFFGIAVSLLQRQLAAASRRSESFGCQARCARESFLKKVGSDKVDEHFGT